MSETTPKRYQSERSVFASTHKPIQHSIHSTPTIAEQRFAEEHFRAIRAQKPRTICVSVDETTCSQAAFEWALEHVVTKQDRVILLHIEAKLGAAYAGFASLLTGGGRHVMALQGAEMDKTNWLESEYTKLCRKANVPLFKWHVVQHKSPKKGIVQVVSDIPDDIDLLIMGTHDDKMVGSVANYVTTNVTCPVLVVTETKTQREERVREREAKNAEVEKQQQDDEETKRAVARAQARRDQLEEEGHSKAALKEFVQTGSLAKIEQEQPEQDSQPEVKDQS